MRLRLTLPKKIVFGVFACSLVVFGALHATTFLGVYFLDRVADVNHLSLPAGQPRQLARTGAGILTIRGGLSIKRAWFLPMGPCSIRIVRRE